MGTPAVARDAAVSPVSSREPVSSDGGRFVSLCCGLAAAWVAAGSVGLLGHPLRHAFTSILLAGAVLTGLPRGAVGRSLAGWVRTALGAAVVVVLAGSSHPPVNVLAAAFALAWVGGVRPEKDRPAFLAAAFSILVLGLYRFAVTSIPWVWSLMDALAPRTPWLQTGATYGGFDFLVLMFALLAACAMGWPGSWAWRAGKVALVILGAHMVYLVALACVPAVLKLLPTTKPEVPFGTTPPWDAVQAVRTLLPWNVPALAAVLHLAIATWLFKSLSALPQVPVRGTWKRLDRWPRFALPAIAVGMALILPALTSLHSPRLSLEGKKIVVYEKGFLNWLKPKHGEYGRLSVGMYGMLPEFLRHFGATCVVSPELSAADLQGAHLLVLIFPNKPWSKDQLERIWNFVREGGSLLILGEHTVREKEGGDRFNDVLQPTALRVAFDSAMFEVGGWLESYEALSHPAAAGLQDYRNDFGVVIGASVQARWPARPMLAGRFGFSDPGDLTNDESKGGSMMGNHKYDAGEKLGDQLLAAEQRFGRGRVVAFGDTSGFSNSILFGSHDYVARLFASLCQDTWVSSGRLAAAVLGLIVLIGVLWHRRRPATLAFTALAFALSLSACLSVSHDRASVLPNGGHATPNRLAYVDVSHHERASAESWREEGPGGLQLTLMRSGYTVLGMDEFDAERLRGAGLLVALAPGRPFSAKEILAIREFIASGGIFICTVGWPEAGASRGLLSELGFYVGGLGAATSGHPEPKSFGHFKAPYFNGGDYFAYVRFHAAWNVESTDPEARALAYGPRDPKGPPEQPDPAVILMRRIGRGKAVVVADTEFALNKNIEREGGQPFEGMRENADFWRWLLEYLNDQPAWTPPKPAPPAAEPGRTNTNPAP